MNLYFLLEGKQTEPQLYRQWLAHALPELRKVRYASELTEDGFVLRSAGGCPRILERIRDSVEEVESAGVRLDQFFVCLDAEEETYHERYATVARHLQKLNPSFSFAVIVQNCCIETWLLGNRSLLKPPPKTDELRELRAYYDVSQEDPEKMPTRPDYATRALFHQDYLKSILRDLNTGRARAVIRGTKSRVGYFGQPSHLNALVERRDETKHLASFGHLLNAWRELGAEI